ncbi:DEAD/DEAH box helicase [Phormidesmis sp. 146-12]
MTDSQPNLTELRQQLIENYQNLAAPDRAIVQLLSVIYEPVSRTAFLNCVNHTGTRDARDKAFVSSTLKVYLDRLLESQLIIQQGGQGPQCNPLLVEVATRDALKAGRFETFVSAIERFLPIPQRWKDQGPRNFKNEQQLIREVRIGLYRKDVKHIEQQLEDYERYSYHLNKVSIGDILTRVCNNPFDADWFCTLPQELYETALICILNDSLLNLTPAPEAFSLLRSECEKASSADMQRILLTEQLLLRGQLSQAQEICDRFSEPYRTRTAALRGWLHFLRGEDDAAIGEYTIALTALQKGHGKKKAYLHSVGGLFFVLALLRKGSGDSLKRAEIYAGLGRQAKHWLSTIYVALEKVAQFQQGDLSQKEFVISLAPDSNSHSLEILFLALCVLWVDANYAKTHLPKLLEPFYRKAESAEYRWLMLETGEILLRLKPRSPLGKVRQENGIVPLAGLIQHQEPWELCLTALTNLHKDPQPAAKSETHQRLAWFVTYSTSGCLLQPREQALNAKGEWGKGRNIALKRLTNPNSFSYLTQQDVQVCSHLKAYNYGYYGQIDYAFGERAIVSLIGHPLVFWDATPATKIEVVKGEPELLVKKGKGDQLTLQFSPDLKGDKKILAIKETPTRLKVIEITAEHRRIAEILGKENHLQVPTAAKERVLAAIQAVSSIVTVHSDIGGGVVAEEVSSDPKPHIHLLPAGTGLKVAVLVRPFAQGGSYYRPGAGGAIVLAEIEGKRLQTTRNLREEKQLAQSAIEACSTLSHYEEFDGEWLIEDPEDCLELLLELQNIADRVILEWPQGEKLRVSHHAGLNDFKLKIQRQNDWFDTTGEVRLDDDRVLDMQRLMELVGQSSSRFIPLGNGEFVALTQEFRKRLDDLRTYGDKQGKGLRIHPLAALAIEDWIDEVGDLKVDQHWKAHIQRLKEVQTLEPDLPSTLQADLRDYQIDGFRWMTRLAHWGVGACLADDMGLGKTLQSLAVILTRAPQGATLIVAPTSVCMNWMSEAQRFAPTLNMIQFGSGDRQKVLDDLQPFDVLVCSYGLLQQEELAEKLAKVSWQTIVLDEAQSIKNFATKRSQAAMNLQGGFKLLTTGTPIENHLGELWNLFRFINPGLLGSLESFNQRFATPIEKYGDKQARNQLKKLIQPFLLRRTKNQVLEELPSRTEIVLNVELSSEEMAFYEALRREAISKLSNSDAAAGQKHLQVLAEIMKLRRACCNTQLVSSDMTLPSAKLQLFGEVLAELLDNRHKALVFSQFVDHLHLIRDYLDRQNIRYQYLDGSTPAGDRKKRVDAFQSGNGDVFLISLKAGGTGLNLTAADYVIHMDPWWNPAVEDQASDRAHRIGQHRPVTIYRLVAEGTIEEKIVNLHHHKRDLADSLLEGTEMSGKVSTDELLRLISEG